MLGAIFLSLLFGRIPRRRRLSAISFCCARVTSANSLPEFTTICFSRSDRCRKFSELFGKRWTRSAGRKCCCRHCTPRNSGRKRAAGMSWATTCSG